MLFYFIIHSNLLWLIFWNFCNISVLSFRDIIFSSLLFRRSSFNIQIFIDLLIISITFIYQNSIKFLYLLCFNWSLLSAIREILTIIILSNLWRRFHVLYWLIGNWFDLLLFTLRLYLGFVWLISGFAIIKDSFTH